MHTYMALFQTVLMAVTMFFMPDSPKHLVDKEKEEDARKAIKWLKGSDYLGVEDDIYAIKNAEVETNDEGNSIGLLEQFTKLVYLKPLCISLGLMLFQQFTGVYQILFSLQDIFEKSGSDLDKGLSAFIVTFMQVN